MTTSEEGTGGMCDDGKPRRGAQVPTFATSQGLDALRLIAECMVAGTDATMRLARLERLADVEGLRP